MASGEDKNGKEPKNENGKVKSSGSTDKSGERKTGGKSSDSSKTDRIPRKVANGHKNNAEPVVPNVEAPAPVEGAVLEQILGQLNEISRDQRSLGQRFDDQDERIKSLETESNIKNASGSGTKKVPKAAGANLPGANLPGADWDSDDDEILGSVASFGQAEEEVDEEKDEEPDLDEIITGKAGKGMIPEDYEIDIFKKRCMFSSEYSDDDWIKYKAKNTLRYWTSKPEARDFIGQKVDVDCPDLKYTNKKKMEKDLQETQKYLGGVSFAQIRLGETMKELIGNAGITMGEFANPDVEMQDSRQEAAQALENVKETATNMLKTVASIGKMVTFSYLKLLAMRRNQYVEATDRSKVARDMVKRLKPSSQYLFGDQIKSVCLTLKNGSQLSSQLQSFRHGGSGGGGGRGRGGFRGGRGLQRGFRGARGFRGGRGARGHGKKDG